MKRCSVLAGSRCGDYWGDGCISRCECSRLVNGVRFNLHHHHLLTLAFAHTPDARPSQPARIKYVGACATIRMERQSATYLFPVCTTIEIT
jgi:hypothetical protein